ncbi:Queuine tRNA-ribosyltransferase catalytic subunit 1 [Astathelohania contejeani]|uniref:Queuine tRNA-ribosyltransferase catalytic subunit 1 n=1 Tax=Astathelohania contejeani TaxID=164912 RepID=A0ABQ7HXZ5_9MICR|nr:Queuine tRNA-ribosyltransferase catalytic subunit 1 [Thelohania contejeani]
MEIIKKCSKTKARISKLKLKHKTITLPTFMPVATYGAMKGILPHFLNNEIILGNTYHLRNLNRDLPEFMGFNGAMLTDSGGFQITSIATDVTEEGVIFDGKLFTPEDSIAIQNTLGCDIIMQLDDVCNPMENEERASGCMERSIRWLDRCMKAHKNKDQFLFPIVQGGLCTNLREKSINEIIRRSKEKIENKNFYWDENGTNRIKGVAIGGLSGGEDKKDFLSIVNFCTDRLPSNFPRYVMGVGYPEDVLMIIALGSDMSDCVYPTRTARFGRALTDRGNLNLLKSEYSADTSKLVKECLCYTCRNHTRAYIHSLKGTTNFCMLLTVHNLFYMKDLVDRARSAINEDRFDKFLIEYYRGRFKVIPDWVKLGLNYLGIEI